MDTDNQIQVKETRYFCYSYVKDGELYTPDQIDNHFSGKVPKHGANKIASVLMQSLNKDNVIFRLDEKIYIDDENYNLKLIGIYMASHIKLDEPVSVKVGDHEIKYWFKNEVVKIKSRDELNEEHKIEYDLICVNYSAM